MSAFLEQFAAFVLAMLLTFAIIYVGLKVWDFFSEFFGNKEPKGPEITAAELEEFARWHETGQRQCQRLRVLDYPPTAPLQSRLGGRPWVDEQFQWPLDSAGDPLHFVAQINAAELGELADFPKQGLWLFFVSRHGGLALGQDSNLKGDTRVMFYPNPTERRGTEVVPPYKAKRGKMFPFHHVEAFQTGRRLEFETASQHMPLADWRFEEREKQFINREGEDKFESLVDEMGYEYPGHFVGGYAQFVQQDPRTEIEEWRAYDIPILNLGFDDYIMFGDAGEANFLVSREDLRQGRFDDYLFTWDCG